MTIKNFLVEKHGFFTFFIKYDIRCDRCRTLLKKGNQEVLAIFGYHDANTVEVQNFIIETPKISIGEKMSFSFAIFAKRATKVRLEYGINYIKANGKQKQKIFKLSEISLKEKEQKTYVKNHSFADVSVRKHYPGLHSIALFVNGVEQGTLDFQVKA